MRKSQMTLSLLTISAFAVMPATSNAKGCLAGGAVGGVAGHVAGHHAVLGAAAGCAIGHHEAKVKDKKAAKEAQQAQPTNVTPAATGPVSPHPPQ